MRDRRAHRDMVIRGGGNSTRADRGFLYRHPKVLSDVQVVGVPDQKYGEGCNAWIIVREGQDARRRGGRGFLQGQIAHLQRCPSLHQVREQFSDDRDRQDPRSSRSREQMKRGLGLNRSRYRPQAAGSHRRRAGGVKSARAPGAAP